MKSVADDVPSENLLGRTDVDLVDAWWRTANYLSVGQIYLRQNALLARPLRDVDVKSRLLGHWGTTPGLNFVWSHLNRVIVDQQRQMLLVVGPGHGGPAVLANAWLERTYSELHPDVDRGERGMNRLFQQFSYPGGVRVTRRRTRPGRSTKEGSSATRWPTPTERRSTTLIS